MMVRFLPEIVHLSMMTMGKKSCNLVFPQVQSQATKIDTGLNFFVTISSLLVAPFWGLWTDKSGRRKPALMSPSIGSCLSTAVDLIIMYLKLPLYLLFVGAAISGFSGFLPTLILGSMAYIADTTDKSRVALRLGEFILCKALSLLLFPLVTSSLQPMITLLKSQFI